MKRSLSALACAGLLTLGLAVGVTACGDSDDDPASSGTDTSDSVSVPADDGAADDSSDDSAPTDDADAGSSDDSSADDGSD
jgi:hypothetical protein